MLVGASQVVAQNDKNSEPKQATAQQVLAGHYARTYQAAMRYNDYSVAKQALYNILVEYPNNDSILYSLSLLYYQSQQNASAALTANDVLALNPDNVGAMEIAANALERLGAKDRALEKYEDLYLKTDDYNALYKMAFLQYDLKKYGEAMANVDILLGKKETEELTATFSGGGNEQEEFPIKAALYNLKGLIYKGQDNKNEAKANFEKALEIAPEFELAKNNMEEL